MSDGASTATSGTATGAGQHVGGNSAAASRLFEKVTAAEQSAAAQEVPEHLQPSTAGRVAGAIGNALLLGGLGASAFFGYYTYRYSPEEVEAMIDSRAQPESDNIGNNLWTSTMRWYLDKRRHFESEIKKYSDPPSDALLPDLPPHARHVRTLVLDLDNVLVHSDWSRARGWRTFKRPGAEDFLKTMSQFYEVVVYTSQLPTYADPILDRLDPNRYIAYRLYRDSTQYKDGKHVRDLEKLNRDPQNVLMITSDPDAYYLQPDNAIKLEPWKLEAEDTKLLDLLPFLEAVVRTGVPDVRSVIRSYEGQDIPTSFRERMAKLQSERKTASKGFLGGLRR